MVRERIKELVEFATTESPYRDANKGWLTEDVYVQWGSESQGTTSKQGKELANVSVYWNPINQIISILFVVVSLAAVFVFTFTAFAHGRLKTLTVASPVIPQTPQIELKESLPVSKEPTNQFAVPDLVPVLETTQGLEESQTQNAFAAAALGGQKIKNE